MCLRCKKEARDEGGIRRKVSTLVRKKAIDTAQERMWDYTLAVRAGRQHGDAMRKSEIAFGFYIRNVTKPNE